MILNKKRLWITESRANMVKRNSLNRNEQAQRANRNHLNQGKSRWSRGSESLSKNIN